MTFKRTPNGKGKVNCGLIAKVALWSEENIISPILLSTNPGGLVLARSKLISVTSLMPSPFGENGDRETNTFFISGGAVSMITEPKALAS
ncbi:MAG: hypothetical protein ACE5PV_22045, partial [Candidatus Poribacteria bacterium]